MRTVNHFAKAVELMARVDDMADPTLPVSRALTTQALVHATLAQCPTQTAAAATTLTNIYNGVRRAETTGDRL